MMGLSTGFDGLDQAMGQGIPQGRVTELFGCAFATTIGYSLIARAQAAGAVCAFIDFGTLVIEDAARRGVDPAALLVSQPDTLEMGIEIVQTLVRTGAVDLIVIGVGDREFDPRVASRGLRALTGVVMGRTTAVVLCRPVAEDAAKALHSAIKFYSSVRVRLYKGACEAGDRSCPVRAKVIKNKVAPPFAEASLDIQW